jgi:hypothetical protein
MTSTPLFLAGIPVAPLRSPCPASALTTVGEGTLISSGSQLQNESGGNPRPGVGALDAIEAFIVGREGHD